MSTPYRRVPVCVVPNAFHMARYARHAGHVPERPGTPGCCRGRRGACGRRPDTRTPGRDTRNVGFSTPSPGSVQQTAGQTCWGKVLCTMYVKWAPRQCKHRLPPDRHSVADGDESTRDGGDKGGPQDRAPSFRPPPTTLLVAGVRETGEAGIVSSSKPFVGQTAASRQPRTRYRQRGWGAPGRGGSLRYLRIHLIMSVHAG